MRVFAWCRKHGQWARDANTNTRRFEAEALAPLAPRVPEDTPAKDEGTEFDFDPEGTDGGSANPQPEMEIETGVGGADGAWLADDRQDSCLIEAKPAGPVEPCATERSPATVRRLDLAGRVFMPGMLHITHNCVRDLASYMNVWAKFDLRHICRMLSWRYSKQRLFEACFVNEPRCFFAADYKHFFAKVYEDRWGSVSTAVAKQPLVKRSLRKAWSLAAFNFGRNGRGRAHEQR